LLMIEKCLGSSFLVKNVDSHACLPYLLRSTRWETRL